MPSLVIIIDGTIGYWDENKVFYLRSSVINNLIKLSTNVRLIAVAVGQTKKCVTRLCKQLSEKNEGRKPLVFDAVYLVAKIKSGRVDITHALLDCYDET